MRSSGAKGSATNSIDGPVENGISHKDEDEARVIAEKVVQSVVKRAEREAEQRSPHRSPKVPRLPTFQIDTVPSPPWSPVELSPVGDEQEPPIDEEQIDLHIEDQPECSLPDDLRESLRSYVEDILSQAMGVVEKKLKFVGIDDDDDESEEESHHQEEVASPPPPPPPVEDEDEDEEEDEEEKRRREEEEEEIRAAAQKVVEEVIAQAQERIEKEEELQYPDLPSFQIDTVVSAPPSPEQEQISPQEGSSGKKWTFRMQEDEKPVVEEEDKGVRLMNFEQAPEDVKEVASNLVKEIVGKAIAIAEEKSVPTVPFNFEDVDLMKTSGPWYVRVREALLRVLRSACFCTPRRNDS